VLAIDLPGFGRSEARVDSFAPRRWVDSSWKAIDGWAPHIVHAVDFDVDRRRSSLPRLCGQTLPQPIVGAGATVYPVDVDGALKWMIEAEPLPPLNTVESIGGF